MAEAKEKPKEDDLPNIGWAARSLFIPAETFGSSDVEYNNEQMQDVLQRTMGMNFEIYEMIRELTKAGYKQLPAGDVMYWLLKRK